MGGNEINGSIGFGGKRTWSYNDKQKGIGSNAFELKAEDGASKKDIKRLNKQNAVNKQLFNFFDRNKDGVLDQGELQYLRDTINRTANSYSKGDGTIDAQEAEALYKFVQYDAKGVGSATRENLYNFLNTLNDTEGKDGVASANTDEAGVTTLDLGGGNYDKYKMENVNGTPTKVVLERVNVDPKTGVKTTTKYDGGKLTSYTEESADTITEMNAEGKPVKITKKDGSSTTTFNYDKTPPTAEVKSGASTVTYALNQDGSVNTDKPLRDEYFAAKLGENVVDTYTWGDNSVTVKNGEDGTTTVYGLTPDGKLDEKNVITTDAKPADDVKDSELKDKEYAVKKGETWYDIAAKEYGLKDHADIMKAVHVIKDQYLATGELKATNRGRYMSSKGPESINGGKINLPASIQIGDKTVYLGGEVADTKAETAAANVETEPEVKTSADVKTEEVKEEPPVVAASTVNSSASVEATKPVTTVTNTASVTPKEKISATVTIPDEYKTITPAEAQCLYNLGEDELDLPALNDELLALEDGSTVLLKDNVLTYVAPDMQSGAIFELDEGRKNIKSITAFQGNALDLESDTRADLYDGKGAYTGSAINHGPHNYKYDTSGQLTDYSLMKKFNGNDAEYVYGADGKLKEVIVKEQKEDGQIVEVTYEPDPEHEGQFKLIHEE